MILMARVLYIGLRIILFFLAKRKKIDYLRFREESSSKSNVMQLIDGIQEIKLNNCVHLKKQNGRKSKTDYIREQ